MTKFNPADFALKPIKRASAYYRQAEVKRQESASDVLAVVTENWESAKTIGARIQMTSSDTNGLLARLVHAGSVEKRARESYGNEYRLPQGEA